MAAASIEACPLAGRPQTLKEAIPIIVIGVDVHKHELTAVAVDELGRELSGWSGPLESAPLS